MRIGIFGATGMLGYAVSSYLKKRNFDVIPFGRADFDLSVSSMEDIEKAILNTKIDVIVNCSGVIKPQIAFNTIEAVLRVNSVFPRNLAIIGNRHSIKVIHITTDCVYTGSKGNYSELDFFDADDVYGMTKNAGETQNCMVLRTSIIGEEKGQARSLLEWARSQKGKEVKGFVDHRWNGVTTVQLAKAIETILNKNLYTEGLFHVHSPSSVTKAELLKIFDEVYGLGLKINKVQSSNFCDRTLKSIHPLAKEIVVDDIKAQVSYMKEFFSEKSV